MGCYGLYVALYVQICHTSFYLVTYHSVINVVQTAEHTLRFLHVDIICYLVTHCSMVSVIQTAAYISCFLSADISCYLVTHHFMVSVVPTAAGREVKTAKHVRYDKISDSLDLTNYGID